MNIARALVGLLIASVSISAADVPVPDPIGCYLATPPFRPAVPGTAASDTVHAIVSIENGGNVRQPLLPKTSRILGEWTERGDTLHASLTNGFTGWRYKLTATAEGWHGIAEFITDAIDPRDKSGPVRREANWIRRPCP